MLSLLMCSKTSGPHVADHSSQLCKYHHSSSNWKQMFLAAEEEKAQVSWKYDMANGKVVVLK